MLLRAAPCPKSKSRCQVATVGPTEYQRQIDTPATLSTTIFFICSPPFVKLAQPLLKRQSVLNTGGACPALDTKGLRDTFSGELSIKNAPGSNAKYPSMLQVDTSGCPLSYVPGRQAVLEEPQAAGEDRIVAMEAITVILMTRIVSCMLRVFTSSFRVASRWDVHDVPSYLEKPIIAESTFFCLQHVAENRIIGPKRCESTTPQSSEDY